MIWIGQILAAEGGGGGWIRVVMPVAILVIMAIVSKFAKQAAEKQERRRAEETDQKLKEHRQERQLPAQQAQRAPQTPQAPAAPPAPQPRRDEALARHARQVMQIATERRPAERPEAATARPATVRPAAQPQRPPEAEQRSLDTTMPSETAQSSPKAGLRRRRRSKRERLTQLPSDQAGPRGDVGAIAPAGQQEPMAVAPPLGHLGLREVGQAQNAIVFHEILSQPKALREGPEMWDA